MLNTVIPIFSAGVAAGGDFESIATVTVGSGGSSSITFDNIPSTYTHLQIRSLSRNGTNAGNYFLYRLNNDSTVGNYSFHQLYGDGSSASSFGVGLGTYSGAIVGIQAGSGASSNVFGITITDILDYTNTNKLKTLRALSGFDNNGSGFINFASSLWNSTSAITSIVIVPNGGDFAQYSHFALYGIKSA